MKQEELLLKDLVQSLQILASDSKKQINYFLELGKASGFNNIPDELALEYHDHFLLTDQIFKAGLVNKRQLKKLNEIDQALDKMSGKDNAKLWTIEALETSSEWRNIRKLAKETLNLLEKHLETSEENLKSVARTHMTPCTTCQGGKNGFVAMDQNMIERLAAVETMMSCGCGGYVYNLLFRCTACDTYYHYRVEEHWPSSSEDYVLYRIDKDEALQKVQELKKCSNLDDRRCDCAIHRDSEHMRLQHSREMWTKSIPQSWG